MRFTKAFLQLQWKSLSGNLFHKIGAADFKRTIPICTSSACLLEERRFLWGMYGVMILVR